MNFIIKLDKIINRINYLRSGLFSKNFSQRIIQQNIFFDINILI